MNRDAWRRVEQLVDQALEMNPDDRRGFLDGLDADARREVVDFLAAEEKGRGFLETPVDEQAAPLLEAIADDESSWDALHLEGETIGPYRVLDELGRGGMGAVFLAERADGQFHQRVALKLVKRGMDTAEILERFRGERQILARLQHENIARLLDGGVSESGQPYFAMEHVEGTPLTRHCDEQRLPIDARLRLFLQVCDAVEYAHRNLVVHRDLKPSNVLVTREGQVKLLDFGIAKVLDAGENADSTTLTLRGARPLTPEYAAPEQLLGQAVTTATDVYSLGVVLYELLSGRPPYSLQRLSPAEIERVVVGQEPEPLGSAVRRADAEPGPEDIARSRGVTPDKLVRALRGELDTVVRTALRKEPPRRYPSVRSLAEDLRSFLQGMPVSAQPDTFGYRLSKFVARHRVGVAASVLAGISVTAGVAGTLWQARQAVREGRKADEVKRFALSLFEVADPDVAKGKEVTARQILERAVPRIESELAGQPEIQAEMLLFVGNIDHHLGLERESRPLFERALELRRGRLQAGDIAIAEAELALAGSFFTEGNFAEAEKLYLSAFERRRKRLGRDHPDTAFAQGSLGRVRFEKGDLASGENLLRDAVMVQRRQPPAAQTDLANNLNTLGRVLQRKGDLAGAESFYREALDIRVRLYGQGHSSVAGSLFNLAAVMREKGDVRGAIAQYRQLLVKDRALLGTTSDGVAKDLNNLGSALVVTGECVEAETLLRESLDVHRRLYGGDSQQLHLPLNNLSRAVRCRARFTEAEALDRDALARAIGMLGEEHVSVAAIRQELARTLRDQGKLPEAEDLARHALATCRTKLGPDHPRLADALLVLGQVLVAAHKAGEGEPLLREAEAIFQKRFGDRDWRTAEARVNRAESLAGLGRSSEIPPDLAASYETIAAAFGPQHPLAVRARRASSLSAAR